MEAPGDALGDGDVYVWLLVAPEEAPDARARRCEALLDAGERARLGRFRAAADARRYLFAHALARTTLSRYAPATPPEAWRFRVNAHGRPEIDWPPETPEVAAAPPLRFNISHTAGLVACAVTRRRDVGVDVEHVHPPRWNEESCLEVAATSFAPAERAGLEAAPLEARRGRFFSIWTLKEAYIKARGLGLALPLARFAFDVDAPEPAIRFEAGFDDDPRSWHFARLTPTPTHALALAVRRARGEALRVQVCEARADSP
jgi:4'-phosphopantetheinyl transferase